MKFEVDNLQWLLEQYDFTDNNMSKLIIDIDNHNELGGADLVVYDVSEVVLNENYKISSIEDLRSHIDTNGLDEESFEINRVTLIRSRDF